MVIYDDCQLRPGPMVKFHQSYGTTGAGEKISLLYSITITGTVLDFKGSPQSGGALTGTWGGPFNRFWQNSGDPPDEPVVSNHRLYAAEAKQEAIRALFSNDGRWLEWGADDGTQPLKCKPRIKNIEFGDGSRNDTWFQLFEFVIEAEADLLYLNGEPITGLVFDELINEASESWEIQPGDVVKTFKLTHNTNATGKRLFDDTGLETQPPWQNARDFVNNRLTLGYDSTSSYSPIAGSDIVTGSSLAAGVIDFSTLSAYNFSRNETTDELAGSYSVTEDWTLSLNPGTDIYSVSVKRISDQPYTTTEVGIQGTIKGFYVDLNDYDTRMTNAENIWEALKGANLFNRVQSYASGVSLNNHALAASLEYNPNEGTVGYNYQFSDRLGDTVYEDYVISKKSALQDYKTSVNIQGKITGRRFEDDTNPNDKFTRALAAWTNLNVFPNIYNRIVSSNFFPEIDGVLRQYPLDSNVDMNQAEGVISYSFDYDTRKNDGDFNDDDVLEEYSTSVSYSREDGKSTFSIQGTVEGLAINDADQDPRTQKYTSALNYFNNIAAPNIPIRLSPLGYFTSLPISLEVEKNPTKGIITYNYKYDNVPLPCTPGALSEVINVSDQNMDGDVNVFGEIPIPLRAAGPNLQDMKTTKHKSRSVSMEIVMAPTGNCDFLASYNLKPNVTALINQLRPNAGQVFVDENTQNWNWKQGRYSKNITWIYQ